MNLETAEKTHVKGRGVMCPRDGFVVFQNSTLMCGRLGKVTLGGGNKSGLFQVLAELFSWTTFPSNHVAADLASSLQSCSPGQYCSTT